MRLPLSIAIQLKSMLVGIEQPSSKMSHPIVSKLVEDGVIFERQIGRTRKMFFVRSEVTLKSYLSNHFGIDDLQLYIDKYNSDDLTRAEAVNISSTSKLRRIRTFKGFLINCYEPVSAMLNNSAVTIHPEEGTFSFIYDFESFVPAENITIVGIENPENFRWTSRQKDLFKKLNPLFVSRYPQSNDLIKWLQSIPNSYLHFGDFDFEGINIYYSEYKKHLGDKASFFVPENIDEMIQAKGNRNLYNKQFHLQPDASMINETPIRELLKNIHKYKKVLEQEYLILLNG